MVTPRAVFVTIGQTPRSDVMPDIREWLGPGIAIEERGALDGLDASAITAMAPRAGDRRLVTRLRDGSQAVLRTDLVYTRLQAVFDEISEPEVSCVVLLCTGKFPPFRVRGLFLDAQSIVDHAVAAFAELERLPLHAAAVAAR